MKIILFQTQHYHKRKPVFYFHGGIFFIKKKIYNIIYFSFENPNITEKLREQSTATTNARDRRIVLQSHCKKKPFGL